jgi:hypothetical protein
LYQIFGIEGLREDIGKLLVLTNYKWILEENIVEIEELKQITDPF